MSRRLSAIAVLAVSASVALPLPAAAQLPETTSDVVIIDAGAEPRQELRYAWQEDQRERLNSVVVVDVVASEAGQSVMEMMLPVSISVDATVTKVDSDGTAWVALKFEEMAFGPLSVAGGGVPDGDIAASEFDEAMAGVTPLLAETRVWQQIDDRGHVLQTNVQFPDQFPPEARQQITQTSNSVALLPAEPVGIGARWETTGTTQNQGVTLSVTSAAELVARDGNEITLAMTISQADEVETQLATVDPFDEFTIEGEGTYRLDLGSVYPRAAEVSMSMNMVGDLADDAGGIVPVEMLVVVGMDMVTTTPD